MSWADPLGDLRLLLNDDASGNLVKDKAVFPKRAFGTDGTIRTFFTFEDRLVSSGNQSVAGSPLELFYDGVQVAASGILVTDPIRGEFTIMGAAPSGVEVRASYYFREHLDNDLNFALRQGAQLLSLTAASSVEDGLQPACLFFSASFAHRKAAARWQYRKASQFLLEENIAQEELSARVLFHTQQATEMLTQGQLMRKNFFDSSQDRALVPAYKLLKRAPSSYTPRR